MAMVRVWNDNVHPYKETFRDKVVEIGAKKFITMEAGEAHDFKGSFAGIMVDGDGNPDPRGFKMIRIEELADQPIEAPKVNELLCLACNYEGSDKKDLSEHISAMHKDLQVVDEEAEAEIRRRPKKAAAR